jgi:hypothetical protein
LCLSNEENKKLTIPFYPKGLMSFSDFSSVFVFYFFGTTKWGFGDFVPQVSL